MIAAPSRTCARFTQLFQVEERAQGANRPLVRRRIEEQAEIGVDNWGIL